MHSTHAYLVFANRAHIGRAGGPMPFAGGGAEAPRRHQNRRGQKGTLPLAVDMRRGQAMSLNLGQRLDHFSRASLEGEHRLVDNSGGDQNL